MGRIRRTRARPVAGKTFAGLAIESDYPPVIERLDCGAEIGGERLRARERFFFPSATGGDKVVCIWRIPAHTAGERLRLLKHNPQGDALVVHFLPSGEETVGIFPRLNWRVRRGSGSSTATDRHPAITIGIGVPS